MKLRRMRVKNFRCVEDSTEFSLCPVTAFVGKNGAGKTSLLEALYKLNPDVEELGRFDVLMEYPRARRREYQRRADHEPDDALLTTWELEDQDVAALENALGAGAVKSRIVTVEKGYYPGRKWAGAIGEHGSSSSHGLEQPHREALRQMEAGAGSAEGGTVVADPITGVAKRGSVVPLRGEPRCGGHISQPTATPHAGPANESDALLEKLLGPRLPKLLYFSEWHVMDGRISMDALLQRRDKGELTGPDRVFLALLELGGTSLDALTGIERSEELIADLEDAARPITAEIAKYWSQERDLKVSFHLYPGRPGDPSPLDRGLIFETRIVNVRTDLSLNFEERSTGFIWFFSFLVWYSDVRKRYGDNLIILLDDPGLGLHANAQWDLLRYIDENLAPRYQIAYATHSPFMVDPEKVSWVRTVEEIVEPAPNGRLNYMGTKVGDEVLSSDHATLLPLQASLGYRIVRDMQDTKRMLLVQKPSDILYLAWFSDRLKEKGRPGLSPAWTIIPCGDLVRLAALVGLLSSEASNFAVLLSVSEKHPDIAGHHELSRILEKCHVFALPKYAEPAESTIEDLIGPRMYPALVDLCYGLPRKRRLTRTMEVILGRPVLKMVQDAFPNEQTPSSQFDPMRPAECLFQSKIKKTRKLPGIDDALARFEMLFAAINAAL